MIYRIVRQFGILGVKSLSYIVLSVEISLILSVYMIALASANECIKTLQYAQANVKAVGCNLATLVTESTV